MYGWGGRGGDSKDNCLYVAQFGREVASKETKAMHCVRCHMGEIPKDHSWAQRPQVAPPTAFSIALTLGRGFKGE